MGRKRDYEIYKTKSEALGNQNSENWMSKSLQICFHSWNCRECLDQRQQLSEMQIQKACGSPPPSGKLGISRENKIFQFYFGIGHSVL